jgi:hypothetical protein
MRSSRQGVVVFRRCRMNGRLRRYVSGRFCPPLPARQPPLSGSTSCRRTSGRVLPRCQITSRWLMRWIASASTFSVSTTEFKGRAYTQSCALTSRPRMMASVSGSCTACRISHRFTVNRRQFRYLSGVFSDKSTHNFRLAATRLTRGLRTGMYCPVPTRFPPRYVRRAPPQPACRRSGLIP